MLGIEKNFKYGSVADIPRLTISWQIGNNAVPVVSHKIFAEKTNLQIGHVNISPKPFALNEEGVSIILFGSPIIDNKIDAERVARLFLDQTYVEKSLKEINGQFLIIRLDRKLHTLTIVNDRFTSMPIYWNVINNIFRASFLFADLFACLQSKGLSEPSPEAFFEFITLQKLLGDKTPDKNTKFLMPATSLTLAPGKVKTSRYWEPDMSKISGVGLDDIGTEFHHLLRQSVNRRTSDRASKRYGHFLSGGHDSRILAGVFETDVTCFTVSFSDNYEVKCARQIAETLNSEHRYIELPDNHFVQHLDEASWICGGMYALDHALFFGMKEQVQQNADVVFHGHGIDYLFHGMYLPAKYRMLLGRPTFYRTMDVLPADLCSYFLENLGFRLKSPEINDYISSPWKNKLTEFQRASVEEILDLGRELSDLPLDQYEYMITHALARHYAHPNISSMMTCGEQRTAAFDNDLYDFYHKLPAQYRLHGEVLRSAMHQISPEIAAIPTANWGMPAGASPTYKTGYLIGRKLLRHLTGNERFQAPSLKDRTWPNREIYLQSHEAYRNVAEEAVNSELLEEALPFLNWKKVRQDARGWLSGRAGGASFLVSLMSIDRFLKIAKFE